MIQYRSSKALRRAAKAGKSEREQLTEAAKVFDEGLDSVLKKREQEFAERMSESNTRARRLRLSKGGGELQQYDEQLNAWLDDVRQRGIEVGEDLKERNWRMRQDQLRERAARHHAEADTPMEMSVSERMKKSILDAEEAKSTRRGLSDATKEADMLRAAQEAGDTGDPRAARVGTDDDFNPMEAPVRDDAARAERAAAEGSTVAEATEEVAEEAAKPWHADYSYKDMQGLAKEYGIPANGKREELGAAIEKAVKEGAEAEKKANASRVEIKRAIDERGEEAVPEGYTADDFADAEEYMDIDGEPIDTEELLNEKLAEYDDVRARMKELEKGSPEHVNLANEQRILEEEIGEIRLQGDKWVPPHMKAPEPPEGVEVTINASSGKPQYSLTPEAAQKQADEVFGERVEERLKNAGLDLETLRTTNLDPRELMERIKAVASRVDLPMNPRGVPKDQLPPDLSRRATNMDARTNQIANIEGAHDLIRTAEIKYKAQNFGEVLDEDQLREVIADTVAGIMRVDRAKRAALIDHLAARTKSQLTNDLAEVLTYGELRNAYAESVDSLLTELTQNEITPDRADLMLLADLFDTMRAAQAGYSEGKSIFGYGLRAPLNQHRDIIDEAVKMGRDACGLKS